MFQGQEYYKLCDEHLRKLLSVVHSILLFINHSTHWQNYAWSQNTTASRVSENDVIVLRGVKTQMRMLRKCLIFMYIFILKSITNIFFVLLHSYRPQTKLRKCNVFTPVCQSFCSQGGCIPACTGACIPPGRPPSPSRRLLLRTVRILMECILVLFCVLYLV